MLKGEIINNKQKMKRQSSQAKAQDTPRSLTAFDKKATIVSNVGMVMFRPKVFVS